VRILTLPGVFEPHSDSQLLADVLAEQTLPPGSRVLDVCTGSGILALRAAQRGWRATAVDRSRRAIWTTRMNAALNGVAVRAFHGDLFDPVAGERFDAIVSNPPYVPAATDVLPRSGPQRAWDAGIDGRLVLDRICAQAPLHLRPGGIVLLTHSSVCGEQQTLRALADRGLEAEVVCRRRGPLGPLLTRRVAMLRERGLLTDERRLEEEILVIRGRAPAAETTRVSAAGRQRAVAGSGRSKARASLARALGTSPAGGRRRR
jgi:release factor glutamine methyltransferase